MEKLFDMIKLAYTLAGRIEPEQDDDILIPDITDTRESEPEFGSSEYNQNVFINACKYRDEMREKWPEEQDNFFEI